MQTLLFLLLITLGLNALAKTPNCSETYARYAEAQTTWQVESTKIVVDMLPEHAQLANGYKDVQLAAIERRKLAVERALTHFPELVNTNAKLNQWIDYSPELEAKLVKISPSFEEAVQNYQQQKAKPSQGNGDQFRQAFRELVMPSEAFKSTLSAFNVTVGELNQIKCMKR